MSLFCMLSTMRPPRNEIDPRDGRLVYTVTPVDSPVVGEPPLRLPSTDPRPAPRQALANHKAGTELYQTKLIALRTTETTPSYRLDDTPENVFPTPWVAWQQRLQWPYVYVAAESQEDAIFQIWAVNERLAGMREAIDVAAEAELADLLAERANATDPMVVHGKPPTLGTARRGLIREVLKELGLRAYTPTDMPLIGEYVHVWNRIKGGMRG